MQIILQPNLQYYILHVFVSLYSKSGDNRFIFS